MRLRPGRAHWPALCPGFGSLALPPIGHRGSAIVWSSKAIGAVWSLSRNRLCVLSGVVGLKCDDARGRCVSQGLTNPAVTALQSQFGHGLTRRCRITGGPEEGHIISGGGGGAPFQTNPPLFKTPRVWGGLRWGHPLKQTFPTKRFRIKKNCTYIRNMLKL